MTTPVDSEPGTITRLLIEWNGGNAGALDELMPLVYTELHRLAGRYLRRERSGQNLQPTELINEAYLRLIRQDRVSWQNRLQFFGIAARIMRRLLVDHARKRRVRQAEPLTTAMLESLAHGAARNMPDVIALDEALNALSRIDPRKARVVELRVFGGLTVDEIAPALDVSRRTVIRDWTMARAWLFQELSHRGGDRP